MIRYDDKSVKYEFISDGVPYTKIVGSNGDFSKFDKFLEVYDRIRHVAKKRQDPNFLHSDPHFGNFLYSESRGAIPIDAGTMLNPDMSFRNIDMRLLGHTFGSLIGLDLGEDELKSYARRFKDILTSDEIGESMAIDYRLPAISRVYMYMREEVAHRVKRRERIPLLENHDNFLRQMENVREALSA